MKSEKKPSTVPSVPRSSSKFAKNFKFYVLSFKFEVLVLSIIWTLQAQVLTLKDIHLFKTIPSNMVMQIIY